MHRMTYATGAYEWYTPRDYIEAARQVMGAIDLDPASSAEANAIMGARHYYTEADDGLAQPWAGRVFLNPPYRRGLVEAFCAKLKGSFENGSVPEAILLVNNATETRWFQGLTQRAGAICFPLGRLKFWQAHTKVESRPLQGQVVLYFGRHAEAFASEFSKFGLVMRLWD